VRGSEDIRSRRNYKSAAAKLVPNHNRYLLSTALLSSYLSPLYLLASLFFSLPFQLSLFLKLFFKFMLSSPFVLQTLALLKHTKMSWQNKQVFICSTRFEHQKIHNLWTEETTAVTVKALHIFTFGMHTVWK